MVHASNSRACHDHHLRHRPEPHCSVPERAAQDPAPAAGVGRGPVRRAVGRGVRRRPRPASATDAPRPGSRAEGGRHDPGLREDPPAARPPGGRHRTAAGAGADRTAGGSVRLPGAGGRGFGGASDRPPLPRNGRRRPPGRCGRRGRRAGGPVRRVRVAGVVLPPEGGGREGHGPAGQPGDGRTVRPRTTRPRPPRQARPLTFNSRPEPSAVGRRNMEG
jgi:hypothetical protein